MRGYFKIILNLGRNIAALSDTALESGYVNARNRYHRAIDRNS